MHIACLLQNLAGGGAERIAVRLMNELVRTNRVSLLLIRKEGPYLQDLHPDIVVESLPSSRTALAAFGAGQWLKARKPDVLVSHLTHVNIAAIGAKIVSRQKTPTVVVEHNQMGQNFRTTGSLLVKISYLATTLLYRFADSVVCVSDGVATSVRRFSGVATSK